MKEIQTFPLMNQIEKLTIYETVPYFYIIGASCTASYYRVLRINRLGDMRTLSLSEDPHEYNAKGINEVVTQINVEHYHGTNKMHYSSGGSSGVLRKFNACCLIGFVKFLEGYYMILVTKQIPIAILGYHFIYTIDDFSMVYIPFTDSKAREPNAEEQKYLKIFQSIDLRLNFYYSYTYDLTNTLQQNLSSVQQCQQQQQQQQLNRNSLSSDGKSLAVKSRPCKKYAWNDHLLRPVINKLNQKWFIHLIHGYLCQSKLNIFGCIIYVTLISRRSQKYAGTRFLKRGGTNEGYVANEVETEQIVNNAAISSFQRGQFTSFVHVRGSIPVFWSQDPKAVPKPPITIDMIDPFASVASRHFNQLFHRFGAPIIVLNLVKMREKKAQESILAEQFKLSIDYLKQFLPKDEYIELISFDMARLNKTDKENLMKRLYEIAESCIRKTAFYQSFNQSFPNKDQHATSIAQVGIVRVNCVDCLDRTNTAMYVIGKCALAHQLHALGILAVPKIDEASVCEKMLIELYERSGNEIARQYAGSQLVHRVDTYGRNSLASQSRDMLHTISRYYSNAFSDADKQNAMNVFLGVFRPHALNYHIWDHEYFTSDCYLHDAYIMKPWKLPKNYIDWIDVKLFACLPFAFEQANKSMEHFAYVEQVKSVDEAKAAIFENVYKPFEISAMHEIFYLNNPNANNISNTNTQNGFTGGNLISIFDPFKSRPKKNNAVNLKNKTSKMPEASLVISSDEDLTDDSYSNQDISLKPNYFGKEKFSVTKSEKSIVYNINYYMSEKSLDIYRKYTETSINEANKMNKSFSKNLINKSENTNSLFYSDLIQHKAILHKKPKNMDIYSRCVECNVERSNFDTKNTSQFYADYLSFVKA